MQRSSACAESAIERKRYSGCIIQIRYFLRLSTAQGMCVHHFCPMLYEENPCNEV